jgi:hypothetical protein
MRSIPHFFMKKTGQHNPFVPPVFQPLLFMLLPPDNLAGSCF